MRRQIKPFSYRGWLSQAARGDLRAYERLEGSNKEPNTLAKTQKISNPSNMIDARAANERLAKLLLEKRLREERALQSNPDGGLLQFVRYFWHVLEPVDPFVEGWPLECMCAHLEAITRGDEVEVSGKMRSMNRFLANVPPGFMKALCCDTPVLTTWGWRKHGDLRPGDFVFGKDGQPKRVLGTTPPGDEDAYEVIFDDGTVIVAGAGHLWEVERDDPYGAPGGRRTRNRVVVTTTELIKSVPGRALQRPDRIPLTEPIQMPPKRVMGLLGHKHIPDDYLDASAEQRWQLLRGLMDTDGCATKEGFCSFTNKNYQIAEGVSRLAASLGMKPCMRSRFTTLNGKKYGPHYMVTFTAPVGARVFNLQRKQERLRGNANERSRHRYVKDVRALGKRKVNCISVEGEIYLAGERFVPTHNSLLVNVFWPAWEWGPMNMPHLRYVAFSYAAELTERDNAKFRDLVTSKSYREMWGHVFQVIGDGKVRVTNDKTGFKFASSKDGVGTGERGHRCPGG